MPLFNPIRRNRITRSDAYSGLFAAVLAGFVVSLFAMGVPKAIAGDDHTAPSAPTNLRVLTATQTSVTLAWDASTDDVGVAGYKLWFGRPPSEKTTETRFTVTGLSCGRGFKVEVRAYDQANNTSWATKAFVSTAPCVDVQPPSAPGGLQQVAGSPTTATLSWSASSDNVAVAGYAVSRGGIELGTTTETSYAFSGLACGKTYPVAVRAYDVARNYSAWVSFYATTSNCGDVSAPTAPMGLVQTDRTVSTMSLAWSPSTDNVGVARYDVFRNGAQVGSTSGVSYVFSNLTCETSHTVGVEAVDGAGNRSSRTSATMSTAACVTPPPPPNDTQPPSTPTNLSLVASSPTSVTLTWSPSTDNVAVTGYGAFYNGVRVQVVTGTTYVFQGLTCGTSHQVGVEGYDASGNHSGRATVTASTSPCSDASPPSTPGNLVLLDRTSSSVTVSWSSSTDNVGVAGYGAYVDGQLDGSTGGATYTFTGLACNASAIFGIDAYDAAGNRSSRASVVLQTAACGDAQAPSTPTQLAVSNKTQTGATLSWAASSDNVAVAGYDVYVNGSKVATVTGTSSAVANLTCNTAYTLGVEAFDSTGNRSSRATVSTTTAACSAPPSGGSTKYVSPGGSDSATCTQSAPCASFSRAYQVASPGDVVEVAGGSYPAQTLAADPTKTSTADVVFKAAGGASVTLGSFAAGDNKTGIGPKHFELRDLKIGGSVVISWGTQDVTLRNIDAGVLNFTSTRDVKVYGGDYGPWVDGVSHIKACGVPGCFPAEDILIDGALFHDFTITDPEKHSECLMIWPGRRVTIRNSTFRNCTDFDVLVKPYNTGLVGLPGDIVFENNFFDVPMPGETATVSCNPGCPRSGNAIAITDGSGEAWSGASIRYNSSLGGIRVDEAVTNVVVKANVAAKDSNYSCQSNASFSYNVWSVAKCSSTDRSAALSTVFVGATSSSFDLNLKAGSAPINGGDPGDYPPKDKDGTSRPQGGAPDAGADEKA